MVNPFQAQYAPTDLQAGSAPTGTEVAHFVQGGVSVGLTVAQIAAFAAQQNTWVPVWTGSGNGAAVTMTGVSATFIKINNLVVFFLAGTISNINAATGTLRATLPTTAAGPGGIAGRESVSTGHGLASSISAGATTFNIVGADNGALLTNTMAFTMVGSYLSA